MRRVRSLLLTLTVSALVTYAFRTIQTLPRHRLYETKLRKSKCFRMSSDISSEFIAVEEPNSSSNTINTEIPTPTVPTTSTTKTYASMSSSSVNLLKNCLGAGVFSLNSRITSISPNPMTIIPASFLVLTMALWASYNFFMVGETCRLTDTTSYSKAWSKSVSYSTEWILQTF